MPRYSAISYKSVAMGAQATSVAIMALVPAAAAQAAKLSSGIVELVLLWARPRQNVDRADDDALSRVVECCSDWKGDNSICFPREARDLDLVPEHRHHHHQHSNNAEGW